MIVHTQFQFLQISSLGLICHGLDKDGVAAIRELLLKMKEQGKVTVLVSHNREDIDVLCDEVFEVEKGIIRQAERAI